ncbi:MAG: TIGR00730 family Rossman fold protein [Phycisphaerae bacterium]|nr:TIGR00730 family Rossman fold protein [Phycisphaerae bacterium]
MKSICVFCGSSAGTHPIHAETARSMGQEIARRGIRLVYGGGHVGLMGIVADAALNSGGSVTGVITRSLMECEVGHSSVTELHVVDTMHDRKALMARESDGFVAMPGGLGTLEELFEVWTWGQLGIHQKPCAILNVDGFYDGLLAFLRHSVNEGFLRRQHFDMVLAGSEPAKLLDNMAAYRPPALTKWLDLEDV